MKKLICILMLFCIYSINYCFAKDINNTFDNVREAVDVLSEVNQLREQIIQTNMYKEKLEQKNNSNAQYSTNYEEQSTLFNAKSFFARGNVYIKQEKYREAIDSYYEAKKLFELANDKENAKKAEEAMNHAIEMRCEFGDYCQ